MKFSAAILSAGLFFLACTDTPKPASVPETPEVPFARTAPVVFTEVTPQNLDFEDEDGEHSDWVEFFNPADTAVQIHRRRKVDLWERGNSPAKFFSRFSFQKG